MAENSKIKMNSSDGCKISAVSVGKKTARKTVCRSSNTGRFIGKAKTENSTSEADELTLRAWKKKL